MEQQQEHKARYSVGEKLYVIHFSFEGSKDICFRMPFLYDMAPISKINIIELVVKEHHKVHGEWDDNDSPKIYDGFILEDKDGNIWHNQYPRAYYGQISDEGDREFTRCLPSDTKFRDLTEKGIIFEAQMLSSVFWRINRGIKELNEVADHVTYDKVDMRDRLRVAAEHLTKCKANIEEILEKDFGKTLIETVIWEGNPSITNFCIADAKQPVQS
jgi:hypothetical protein